MKVDLCIIGAGPAGYAGALTAARAGKKVALLEKDRPGGTCLNRGCIPTKALRRCADALIEARESARFGVQLLEPPRFDYPAAAAHRDQAVESLVAGVVSLLRARKVSLVKGEARLLGPGRVQARTESGLEMIEAPEVVIAAGARPSDLPGVRIDEERILSSEGALKMAELPESLLVLGGGVIGCEFADLMAAFGVKVTVVETLPRILLNEDRSTARAVQKALEARGVKFALGATVEEVDESGPGLACRLSSGELVSAQKMIVSVGRRPALEGLGLEAAGVELEQGAVKVDSSGRTSLAGVWAAGDVIGPPMLAHAAAHEMEVVVGNILGRRREFDRSALPAVVFTRPEAASVGLLEDAAKAEKLEVSVGRFAYAANGKAQCLGETEGMAKVIVEPGSGRILGGSIVGAHAGELIHELAVAIKARLAVSEFVEIIHAHPTLSELVLEAVADAQGLALHKAGRSR